jgi:hypothetical protein
MKSAFEVITQEAYKTIKSKDIHPVIRINANVLLIVLVFIGFASLVILVSISNYTAQKEQKEGFQGGVIADDNGKPTNVASGTSPACQTDCGKYIEIQDRINTLQKMVSEVSDQEKRLKEHEAKLNEISDKMKNQGNKKKPDVKVEDF